MAIENGLFEDVFPIENGDFPASYVSLPKGNPDDIMYFGVSTFNDLVSSTLKGP